MTLSIPKCSNLGSQRCPTWSPGRTRSQKHLTHNLINFEEHNLWNLSELILISTWKPLGQLCTPAFKATQCSIEEHLGKDSKNRPSGYHSKVPKHAWKYFSAHRTWISLFFYPIPKTITCHGMLQVHIIKIQHLFPALSSIHLLHPVWTSFAHSCLVFQFRQTGLFVTLNEKKHQQLSNFGSANKPWSPGTLQETETTDVNSCTLLFTNLLSPGILVSFANTK